MDQEAISEAQGFLFGLSIGPIVPLIVLYNVLAIYLFSKKFTKKRTRQVPAFLSGIIKIFFQGALTVKTTGPTPLDKEYQLFGYPAPGGLVNSFGLFTIVVAIAAIFTFFTVFVSNVFCIRVAFINATQDRYVNSAYTPEFVIA